MEISRKKISDEDIYKREKELAEEVNTVIAEFSKIFSDIGYELESEFSRDNENVSEEEEKALAETSVLSEAGVYKDGYISNVKITVKRPKSEEELIKEADENEEFSSAEEAMSLDTDKDDGENSDSEQIKNDITLARSSRELARSIAFTSMFLVRVYKTFWHETVSISDGVDEIRNDLSEFSEKLSEKDSENENS